MNKRQATTWVRKVLAEQGVTVRGVRHVYPRASVLAKIAPETIIVAIPAQHDCEPQLRRFDKSGYEWVCQGDVGKLKTGDWCIIAYVCTPTSGEHLCDSNS